MKSYIYILVFSLSGISIQSCQHHPIEPYNEPAGNTDSANCDPDSIYFNRDVMPIIQSSCAVTGCHGGGSAEDGVDLTTYASIMSTADVTPFNPGESDLYEAITETDPDDIMPQPPNDPLTPEQIAIILEWINQGAQNNFCFDCDESIFTFSGAVSQIIADNCAGCHSGGSPSAGISLTTYEEIETSALSGALFGVINHDGGYAPMPYGLAKLSDCKINQVKQWIDNGALND